MLTIHFCQKSYPTDRGKKIKEPVGKPQGIFIQVVCGESTRVLTEFPPPDIFIAHCKVAFSI